MEHLKLVACVTLNETQCGDKQTNRHKVTDKQTKELTGF